MHRAMVFGLLGLGLGFAQSDELTVSEIENAFNSKAAGHVIGNPLKLSRREIWRVKEVRGWALRFKHLNDKKVGELRKSIYQAVAKKGGTCAVYGITETIPSPMAMQYIKPSVAVEALGRKACR